MINIYLRLENRVVRIFVLNIATNYTIFMYFWNNKYLEFSTYQHNFKWLLCTKKPDLKVGTILHSLPVYFPVKQVLAYTCPLLWTEFKGWFFIKTKIFQAS